MIYPQSTQVLGAINSWCNSWSHDSLRQLQRWAGWSPSPCRSKCWLFVATVLWSAPKHNAKPTMLWKHGLFSGWCLQCLFELFCVLFRWLQADKNRADGDGMVDVPKESRHELKRPRGQAAKPRSGAFTIYSFSHVEVDISIWLVVWNHGILFFQFFHWGMSWSFQDPKWLILFRGVDLNHQAVHHLESIKVWGRSLGFQSWLVSRKNPTWILERENNPTIYRKTILQISSELAQIALSTGRVQVSPIWIPTLNIPSMVPNMCKSPTKLWFLDVSWKVFANFDCQAACCWTESFAGGLIIYKSVGSVNPFWVQDVSQQFDNIMLYV